MPGNVRPPVPRLGLLTIAACAIALMAGGCGSGSKPNTSTSTSTHTSTSTSSTATQAKRTSPTPSTVPTTNTAPAQTTTTASATATANVVSASAGGVSATLRAATHHPKVQVPWPVGFTVTHGGAPAHASVSYEYLFAGQVVAHRSHYTFAGRFSDTFHWPSSAVGYPLTFRAVIVSAGVTINLDYPVQVVG